MRVRVLHGSSSYWDAVEALASVFLAHLCRDVVLVTGM